MQDRRHFLKQASAFAVGFAGLHAFVGCSPEVKRRGENQIGFGPLRADFDGVIDLPGGFSYRIACENGAGTNSLVGITPEDQL